MKPNEKLNFNLRMTPGSIHTEKTDLQDGDVIHVTFYEHYGLYTHSVYLVSDNEVENGTPDSDNMPIENGQHVIMVDNGKHNVMFVRNYDGNPDATEVEFTIKFMHHNDTGNT